MPIEHFEKLFRPKTIAVIGKLNQNYCKGNILLKNLKKSSFAGEIFAIINLSELLAIDKNIDIAIFTCPIEEIYEILLQVDLDKFTNILIASGVHCKEDYHIINSIKDISKKHNIRLLGYNSIGLIVPSLNLNLSFCPITPNDGNIALISQSGAIVSSMVDYAKRHNIGFKYVISLGTIIDVDFGDLIDFLWGENDVNAIILYIEKIRNVKKFLSSARHTSRIKPILGFKSGNNDKSYEIIKFREGENVGTFDVYDNAFKRAGIIRVEDIDEIVEAANILTRINIPEGEKLAVITNSGASGILVVDELHKKKLKIIEFNEELQDKIKQATDKAEYLMNPIDISGFATEEDFIKCSKVCLKEPNIDTLMIVMVMNGLINPGFIIHEINRLTFFGKNIIFICLGSDDTYKLELKKDANTFLSIKEAVDAYYYGVSYRYKLRKLTATPPRFNKKYNFNFKAVSNIINMNLIKGEKKLNIGEVKKILESYELPVPKYMVVEDFKEIFVKADEIGYPVNFVVIKNNSTDKDSKKIKNAKLLKKYIEKFIGDKSDINEIIIEEFFEKFEIVLKVGIRTDNEFGPYIFLGLGGDYSRIRDEVSIMLPPLNAFLARRLIEKSYLFEFLEKLSLVEKLQDILIKLSYLSSDFSTIKEVIIDPLVAHNGNFYALDYKLNIEPSNVKPPEHFVIAPYPNNYEFTEKLKTGEEVFIRPIMPEDEPMLLEFFYSLSKETNYFRFFSYRKKLTHEQLASFSQIDYAREVAIVAIVEENGKKRIIGVDRLVYYPNEDKYEFAIVVTDKWQRSGIGYMLMQKLIYIAKDKGIQEIYGTVLAENYKMLQFVKKFGFEIYNSDGEIVYIRLKLFRET